MTTRTIAGAALALLASTSVVAQPATTFEPPVITVLDDDRIVRASAFDGEEPIPVEEEIIADPAVRILRSGVDAANGTAVGFAGQDSIINTFSMTGEGLATASSSGDDIGEGYSLFQVTFTVPVETPFSFSRTLRAWAPDQQSEAYAAFVAQSADGGLIFDTQLLRSEGEEETDGAFLTGVLAPDSEISITLWARSRAESSQAHLTSFVFDFDLGDADRDGLLDSWETDGFDFDGDGQKEIDLAELGADPLVKDIFVEIDIMADIAFYGLEFGQILNRLEEAFENAPPDLIDNPAGGGVQLHLVVDGDRPPKEQLSMNYQTERLPAGFWTARSAYFGSADDRSHANWDQIRAAKEHIYRYCLWADTFSFTDDGRTFVSGGAAEGVPSSNFLVASGTVENWESYQGERSLIATGQAGVFMHELGHTLGLFHGGQDEINYKPHYLSVMNYAYDMPIAAVSNQGTQVALEAWLLDYSRSEGAIELDETALVETAGVRGGPIGRKMVWNSAPSGQVSSLNIDWVDAEEIDWNNSGGAAETTPYSMDLSRMETTTGSPAGDLIDQYDSSMVVTTDWDKLVYDHRGPGSPSARGTGFAGSPVEPCLDEEASTALSNASWNDWTAPGALIFSDSFESGNTEAWSAGGN